MTETRLIVGEEDPVARQIAHFVEVLRGHATPIITARDAARTLQATLAVVEAARLGTRVEVAEYRGRIAKRTT